MRGKVTPALQGSRGQLKTFLNLLLFQCVWVASVVGAARDEAWWSLAALGAFLVAHRFLAINFRADLLLAGIAVAAGLIFETALLQAGLLVYAASEPWPGLAPVWLLALWANFALTINGCLKWLHGRYWLAAALGAAGGPLSYFGGLQLGAATTDTALPLLLLPVALVYALVTPALLYAARRLTALAAQRPH